jgi:hypothetical protein
MKAGAGSTGIPSAPHPPATSRRDLLARGARTTAAAAVAAATLDATDAPQVSSRLAADAERLLAMLHDADDRWAQIGYAVEAFVELLINQQGAFPAARTLVYAAQKLDDDIRGVEAWREEAYMLGRNLWLRLSPQGRAVLASA